MDMAGGDCEHQVTTSISVCLDSFHSLAEAELWSSKKDMKELQMVMNVST